MVKTEDNPLLPAVIDRDEAVELLAGLREMELTDSSVINVEQIRRILYADTIEEAFAETPTCNSDDLAGVPIRVLAARLLPSKYNGGKGAFIAADVVRTDTGENVVLTTSAARVAARLAWLYMNELLPRDVVITVVSEATASGHKVYGLDLIG